MPCNNAANAALLWSAQFINCVNVFFFLVLLDIFADWSINRLIALNV